MPARIHVFMDALDDDERLRDRCFISDTSRFYQRVSLVFVSTPEYHGRINRRLILQRATTRRTIIRSLHFSALRGNGR